MALTALMVLIVIGVIVLWVIVKYNGLVTLRNQVTNGWKQIDVQLKRRHDLIPNVVETVKGYAKHERELLENVTRARSSAQMASGRTEQIQTESALSAALGRLIAVAERYPELKANQNFLALQEELSSTENKISFSRQHYNDTVMGYDSRRQVFPAVLFAGLFGFGQEPYWKIEDAAQREVPKVSFT